MPLGLHNGGMEAAFDKDALMQALAGPGKEYRCGGNFWWLDFSYSPVRNIPISTGALHDLRHQIFEQDDFAAFPFEILIALESAPATAADAASLCRSGILKRVSPCLRWCGRPAGIVTVIACGMNHAC